MSISANYPLYVTSSWPGPDGTHESRYTVKPGETLAASGPATIAIPKAYDSANPNDQVTWSATLTRDGSKAETPLQSQGDTGIKPGLFGPNQSAITTHYLVSAQAFSLPWAPGGGHLTLIAKDQAGKVLATENFNVLGTYASVLRPQS
ncbi:MAG: hypothetical protein ACYCW6_28020 [Candidatus Xenobia bacterium]